MKDGIPRISVRMITYNQERLIKRAIESLLNQREYIYEICISDDCSPDHTWDVLQDYSKKYPGIFKLNRNDPNLGIFENYEKSMDMLSGDIVYDLSGDDECGEDWLKTVADYIVANGIDYKNDSFCIYGNYKNIYPNGDSLVFKNDLIRRKNISAVKLSHRGLIGNRSACYSMNVLRHFQKISQGQSHIVESAIDRQLQIYSKKNYYIDKVGNIYYANIGVSGNMPDSLRKEREGIWPFTKGFLEKSGIQLDRKDLLYGRYIMECDKSDGTIVSRVRCFWLLIRSYDPIIGIRCLQLKRTIFAVCRRFPHNKPIHW